MAQPTKTKTTDSPAKQVTGFIAKFDPAIAKLTRAARSVLRKRFPTANELVYDNYNALAIGYSTTERTSDVLFSLAVYASGVNLYFMYGRSLPDPEGLLQGSGNQGAFVRLEDVSVLDKPGVKALIRAAVDQAEPPLPARGRGRTIVKSISAKQRPRRTR
ncbi:MAG TPA: DUF1801 domain-containing protein [Pyrinomonadaceae bacterium]|nr:DUF1801 domain-containing protein [Pyrinomonadaceae bacterium]